MSRPIEGERRTFGRTFTPADVWRFAAVSEDRQPRHTDPDSEGRLMVHGLLTATLPTKIGGDLEVLASTMKFEFLRPVYTGEQITCACTNRIVEEREDRYDLVVDVVCENAAGDDVLTGTIEGLIWKSS
ncbi:MaoC/PaaZ C-terminal domain-containing protein [Haloferacaceae archaeon DSL9]